MATLPMFVLTGHKRLDKAFSKLSATMGKKAIRPGLRKGLKITLKEAKRLTPVKSGMLRRSLKVRAGKRSRTRIIYHVMMGKDFAGETFYGGFQNWGWLTGKRKGGIIKGQRKAQVRRKIKGLDFLGRAHKSTGKKAMDASIKEIYRRIEILIKKVA